MPRTASGSNLSITQLENILRSRKSEQQKLERKRAKLAKQLAKLDADIAALGGGGGRIGGGRVRNDLSLPDAMAAVLSKAGKALPVGEIVDGVQKNGYRSNSANFRAIVNQTLIKERRRFSAAERGVYQLKK